VRATSFSALGTTATVAVTDDEALDVARARLRAELERLDRTCSRFRSDSELQRANARAGATVGISPLFAELIAVALAAAETSAGRVVPTLGTSMRAAGYDRTFSLVRARETWTVEERRAPAEDWRRIELDAAQLMLRTPPGIELDLGATAKAWAADHAAHAIAHETGCGVLVSLGGDIAVAGDPPAGGWPVQIAEDHAAPAGSGPVVSIETGGLATSSTTVRRWHVEGGGEAHHVLNPSTGRPATSCWRTATVAAATCVDANVAATAAIVLSHSAPAWLDGRQLPARLVGTSGDVVLTGGWPADTVAA
jgi:thiamine biosynthesis lipoprotein